MRKKRKSIVVIGGGSGSSVALRGLKSYDVDLTAIVTMFDSLVIRLSATFVSVWWL